jgi:HPt (histidine-containing phosphotransfer) domain-containing protein
MEGDRERCLAAGMDDYLSKPLRREALEAVLGKWLSAGREEANRAPAAGQDVVQPAATPAAADERQPAAGHEPIDMKTLESMRTVQKEGRPDILARIVGLYLKTSPDLMKELQEAVRRREAAGLLHAAHTLKSSSAMVGALRLSEMCNRLEARARQASAECDAGEVAELDAEFARVVRALEAISQGAQS